MSSPQSSSGSAQHALSMEQHPDVMALGARFDQISPTLATKTLHGMAFLAGAYAAISPWVIGFHGQSALAVNDLIVGGAAALLAFALVSGYERIRDWAWVSAACGIWLIITPWVVSGAQRTTGLIVSNVVVGAVIALLGLCAAAMEVARYRRTRTARGT